MTEEKRKPVKIGVKKKNQIAEPTVTAEQNVSHQEHVSQDAPQNVQNVDLSNVLMQMTQMMQQQGDMMKMMQERMDKLESQNKPVADKKEEVQVVSGDNVATYNREAEEGYSEVVNKVWKIMYITAQAPDTRGMPDAAPMMETVNERRRVGNMIVSDTKYFKSEDEAKAYIEMLRQKGTILPGAKIISCYI